MSIRFPVLVTGSSGFIGRKLMKTLINHQSLNSDTIRIIALTHERSLQSTGDVLEVRGDIRDQHFLKRILTQYRIQTVFHLAA